jgi:hypothetical protein
MRERVASLKSNYTNGVFPVYHRRVPPAAIVETVSLDTQVFVATGYGFNNKAFLSLKSHFASGRLKLVMTDITVKEVHARIKESVAEELVYQRSFVNKSAALFNCSIPEVKTSLTKFDPDDVAKDLSKQFESFLKDAKATIIETEDLSLGNVFDKYFKKEPPFGGTEGKRNEFPDAFAIKALSEWAEAHGLQMFVVSKDKLFQQACAEFPELLSKSTLTEVLDHVSSDDEQLAEFVRTETLKREKEISADVKKEFEDRYYYVEDEDGDAEVRLKRLKLRDTPEIIEIKDGEALLQLNFEAEYRADLSYNDSSNAIYDSEEKRLVYFDTRHEHVDREIDLVVEVRVSYEQMEPASFEIIGVSVTEPADGFGVETENSHDWPYK